MTTFLAIASIIFGLLAALAAVPLAGFGVMASDAPGSKAILWPAGLAILIAIAGIISGAVHFMGVW